MTNASGFTRNPLGIIGLFISLIYGCSSIVMTAADGLDKSERLLLIWFLILFPVIVLAAFVYLVVFHHKKLYGPGDYKDEKNFVVSYLPTVYQDFKISQELDTTEEINEEEKSVIEQKNNIDLSNNISDNDNKINIKSLINLASITASNVQEQYVHAENFILNNIELELGIPIKKNVSINFSDKVPITIDGVGETDSEIVFVEVKYPQFGLLGKGFQNRAEYLLREIFVSNKGGFKGKKVRVIFAIGVQQEYRNILENRLNKIVSRISIPAEGVEYKIFDIE